MSTCHLISSPSAARVMPRVQVRYRAAVDACHLRGYVGGSWAVRNGTHKRAFDASSIDVLAIYCPAPRTFVYLLAADYREPCRMFVRAVQGTASRPCSRVETGAAAEDSDPARFLGRRSFGIAKVGDGTPP